MNQVNGARLGMAFNQACESIRARGKKPQHEDSVDDLKAYTKHFYNVVGEIEGELQ